ncbi:PREDICTED: uncharacterized protein LOC106747781 isoform X2 [Dinoponera quadriceps]|uniref:Uncharacterized protein LOC106747781 isoform X2 n=1 Tax=Dinoponera quadriceps TaxID=609295 RepID=A0A6P3XRN8_DINQU|nr:PREDICTED: uncharacterized protein LOC106747781 isoform X2 [Dinoponera quadriceps]
MNLIFLFLAGCAFAQLFLSHAADLDAYLDEKLRQSKIEFIKIHIQKTCPVQEKSYRVHWDKSWRVPLTSEHQPFTINIFDRILILDGNKVIVPPVNEAPSNETLALHKFGLLKRVVKFARSIVWKNTAYMLMCFTHELCSLHTITQSNRLRFRHTIRHRGTPVDAKFFTQRRRLYLIIANNGNKSSVPSVIYRWSGTYMDVISEVMAVGARSVTAFEHRQSTIIVFAQYDAENPLLGSEVYEFRGKDIVKIQLWFTAQPVAVHHYVHGDFNFILMINELEPSSLLCWDGRELLDWRSLPAIEPRSLINIFHMDGDTFVVVAHNNTVQLYKFHGTSDFKREDTKSFKNGQEIVDMAVSLNAYTMIVMLVIKEGDVYWVEQWEAQITSVPIDSSMMDTDSKRECLLELIEVLQARMSVVTKAKASWKLLLPSAENLTISEPVSFDNVILQAGTVDSIEVAAEKEEDILPPHQIEQALSELDRNVDNVLSKWQEMVDAHMSHVLDGSIVIEDAFLEELNIDRMDVDFVNDVKQKEAILPQGEQEFVSPLRAESIFVQTLEADSLCGIPSRYWTLRNDTTNTLTTANGQVKYSNDTVTVHSDLTVEKLRANSLNGTVIGQLIDDLFVINDRQEIQGQITYSNLLIGNLTTPMLNGVPADKLMTTTTNQSFDSFLAKYLEIGNLHVETVNGVPVEEAARKSRENYIRGKVNMGRLVITEDLTVDMNASLIIIPKEPPLQIYQNVTILGDLNVQNIKIGPSAEVFVADTRMNTSDMFTGFWTKYSNQTISQHVIFEDGVSIDNINTKYLNGFMESDFLYTTVEEIPNEFTNLHFENFHVNNFLRDSQDAAFFDVNSEKSLQINEKLHLPSLRTEDIITLAFNGMNVDNIMNGSVANFTGTEELPAIRASRVSVDNLAIRFFNGRKVQFEEGLRVDDDHQLAVLKVPEFHVRSLEVERLNGAEMSLLARFKNLTSSDLSRIVIVGDLTVKDLTVDRVGYQSTDAFLEELTQNEVVITTEKKIENLTARNVTLSSLYGRNFDDFADSVLTKSTTQVVPGDFSARIVISNVTTNFFNERNVSQLLWVDGPLTISGNVTFTDLFVDGDVITSSLNGQQVSEMYDICARDIDLLKVNGSVFWDTSSYNFTSISYLLEKAVTKDEDQIITGEVRFAKSVNAWTVTGPFPVTEKIRDIISDAVIDDGNVVEISGRKIFEEDFITDRLTVDGDLGVRRINDVDIRQFNDSIVKKYREDRITGPLIFGRDVKIEKLRVNNPDFNASIDGAARTVDGLPANVFFENLVVTGDVYLNTLDGVEFDKFVRNRVTLSGNHNVKCSMRFNELLTVTGKASMKKINGILPSDFLLNDVDEMQIISGVKIFQQDLTVQGNVSAKRVNDMDITTEYERGVLTDEDVDVYGNLVFKADVRIREMNTSGLVNGADVRSIIGDLKEKIDKTLQSLNESKRDILQDIAYCSQVLQTSRNVFFYLELEENPMVSVVNVSNVDVLYFQQTTKLSVNVEQPGSHCGLPDDCPCVSQLVFELADEIKLIQRRKSGEIVKQFYDPDGTVVNVMSGVVSSSKQCTSTTAKEKFVTISLNKFKNGELTVPFLVEFDNSTRIVSSIDTSDEVGGYWRDAKIFKHDARAD